MSSGKKGEMTFLEHLEDLRWHLVRSISAILIVAICAFIAKKFIFDYVLIAPKSPDFFTNKMLCNLGHLVGVEKLCINSKPFSLININMSGQFTSHIMVSIIAGIIVAFPYVLWEFWRFIMPALYSTEKRYARGMVFSSSFLFLTGVLFGYYLIVPLSVHFLGTYTVSDQVSNQINLVSYMSTIASVTLASGIIFELPILIYFLTKVGIVTPEFLKKYRKHAIVMVLILSAIITPPDIFSQILVGLPLVLLYEIGIAISKTIVKKEIGEDSDNEDA